MSKITLGILIQIRDKLNYMKAGWSCGFNGFGLLSQLKKLFLAESSFRGFRKTKEPAAQQKRAKTFPCGDYDAVLHARHNSKTMKI